jgi:putative inorganic carbon (HCO3(-)) transporter
MATTTQPAPAERGHEWLLKALSILIVAPFAAWLGYNLPIAGPVFVATVAMGAVAVVVMGYLSLHRFEWLIWVVLLTRPILDITKARPEAGTEASSGQLATLMGIALIVAGPVWLAGISRQGRRLPLGAVSRALLLLTAASLISTVMSADPVVSVLQVARTAGAVMVFVVLEQLLRSRRDAVRALIVCAMSTVFPLIVGLVQLATGGGVFVDGLTRITGSFLHPNSFGFFLVLVLLMGYPMRRCASRRQRWLIDALLVVCLVELLFTYSRGSWIVLAAGLLVVAVLADRRLLLALPVAAVAVVLFVPSVVERLTNLAAPDTLAGRAGNSATWRLAHVEDLLSGGVTIFGVGPKMSERLTVGGEAPHNDAARMLVENGVVGLGLYLAFLVGLVLLARRALRELRTGFDRALAVGFTATVAAFLFDSMGANLITQFVILIYMLALAAIVQAWINTATQTSTDSGRPDHITGRADTEFRAHPSVLVHSGASTAERSIRGNP